MSTSESPTELELLRRLRALEVSQEADARNKQALAAPPPRPAPTGWGRDVAQRQDQALAERRRLAAEAAAAYEAQLERNQPRIAELEAKLAECSRRVLEENARHAETLELIDAEQTAARLEHSALVTPPEPPRPEEKPRVRVVWPGRFVGRPIGGRPT